MRHFTAIRLVVLALCAAASGSLALGADLRTLAPASSPGSPGRPAIHGAAAMTTVSVSDLAFTPVDPGVPNTIYPYDFFRYFQGYTGLAEFVGGISIPAGAVVDYVALDTCDAAGGAFLVAALQQSAQGNSTAIDSFFSTAHGPVAPCAVDYSATDLGYLVPAVDGSSIQLFVVQMATAPTDGTARFGAVEVGWHAIVSPAPSASDFGDVPTSSPQFQFIEALYHAGITAGCGGGNFCPNQPVTRGQIAVFFARALGLSWPQ